MKKGASAAPYFRGVTEIVSPFSGYIDKSLYPFFSDKQAKHTPFQTKPYTAFETRSKTIHLGMAHGISDHSWKWLRNEVILTGTGNQGRS